MNKTLEFKWGVSRGRDTYGYTICSLYVDGKKMSSCNGGGYDMKYTTLGNYIAAAYRDRLNKLTIPMNRRNGVDVQEYYGLTYHDPDFNPGKFVLPSGKTVEQAEKDGESLGLDRYQVFYHESSKVPTENHRIPSIDGACGMSSVERILDAIGLSLQYVTGGRKNDVYVLHDATDTF
jgi:hypothetical protein